MREIKFRAWDKENRKIYSVHTYSFSTLILIDYGYWGEQVYNKGISREDATPQRTIDDWHNDFIVMQYTGLKDRNGREIYEGDIVELKHECGLNEYDISRESVDFRNGCFTISWAFTNGECDEAEVIGNIYENPELLDNK